jgi:hypothetical protein
MAVVVHGGAGQERVPDSPSVGRTAARSFLLPGWGQQSLGQRRAVAYALVEVGLWALWGNRRLAASHSRSAYRDLAWHEARAHLAPRQEGAWAYYETMSHWRASGTFDRDPTSPGTQPEEDPTTYNGSVWQLARDLYVPPGTLPPEGDPDYQRALQYYEAHAYGTAFLWDWSGKSGEMSRYQALIQESDHRFSQATAAVGAVLANHLLSGIDAYLSARGPAETNLRLEPASTWRTTPGRWTFLLSVRPHP